jgi:TonB family protein
MERPVRPRAHARHTHAYTSRPELQVPVDPDLLVADGGDAGSDPDGAGDALAAAVPAAVRLEAPSLMIEAAFRGTPIAAGLIARAPGEAFTIGSGRGAHAPVSPAYVGGPAHTLVESDGNGFTLNLTAVMRATLWTQSTSVAIGPDLGRAEAPLALRMTDVVRVACGDMTFDLVAAMPEVPLPRPWLPAGWRREAKYALGVAALFLLALLIVNAIPSDPRSFSFDDIAASHRWVPTTVMAPEPPPEPELPGKGADKAGGPGAPAARGPSGKAGDRNAPVVARRMARKGPPDNLQPRLDAGQVLDRLEKTTILGMLKPADDSPLAEVMNRDSALGRDAKTVLGDLMSPEIGEAYGIRGLGVVGTGRGGDGTGEGTIGGGGRLGTIGIGGGGPNANGRYGTGVGIFGTRHAHAPEIIPGIVTVKGTLDKEIIRRIIRRHMNEVRFCYEQGLTRQPSLAGRLVVSFMISPKGQVMSSLMQSATFNAPSVSSCVVQAVRRWDFPAPEGGGLVQVSYPFQFSPAGS